MPEMIPINLIDRAALEHLRSKKLTGSFSHYDIWLDQHAYAFTVAKMMDEDLLAEVRAALEDALTLGTGFDPFKKRLKPYLMARGWWGEQVMTDPLTDKKKLVQLGSTRRLRRIFQTNLATAHAAGKWQRIQQNAAALPYLHYRESSARNKRDAHRRYYHLVLPVSPPIWQQIFPPNGYGCRCRVVQIGAKKARELGISKDPEFDFVETENPRTGEKVRVPADITPTFAHNHARRSQTVLDIAAEKHGAAFARDLARRRSDHLLGLVKRPNFEQMNLRPNLLLKHSDIDADAAQALIYARAGTGSQLGAVPAGMEGSTEWFESEGRYYLLEYADRGITLSRIGRNELTAIKQNDIADILYEYTPLSSADLAELQAKCEAADCGNADTADKMAAFLYSTDSGYRAVNPELVAAKGRLDLIQNQKIIQITRMIDDFLSAAVKFQGTTTRKLRGNDIADLAGFLQAHGSGNLIRYSNFTSTSKAGGKFGGSAHDIVLTIHGKSGVDISGLSQYKQEGEVLMPRHAVYRVLSQTEQDGDILIELEETDAALYNKEIVVQLSISGGLP